MILSCHHCQSTGLKTIPQFGKMANVGQCRPILAHFLMNVALLLRHSTEEQQHCGSLPPSVVISWHCWSTFLWANEGPSEKKFGSAAAKVHVACQTWDKSNNHGKRTGYMPCPSQLLVPHDPHGSSVGHAGDGPLNSWRMLEEPWIHNRIRGHTYGLPGARSVLACVELMNMLPWFAMDVWLAGPWWNHLTMSSTLHFIAFNW